MTLPESEETVSEEVVQSARWLRERLLADSWRPRYHFCVPEDMGEPGDPNGAFYRHGRYHLMYLYKRTGGGFCWGHISSADLIHWRHHPDAIGPGDGDEGCFSGGAFVDDDGAAYLSYWMLWGALGIGLARSPAPPYDAWTKSPANPVIRSTEFGITETTDANGTPLLLGSADPSNIWKKEGHYYMLTGNLLVLNKIGRAPEAPFPNRVTGSICSSLQTWRRGSTAIFFMSASRSGRRVARTICVLVSYRFPQVQRAARLARSTSCSLSATTSAVSTMWELIRMITFCRRATGA